MKLRMVLIVAASVLLAADDRKDAVKKEMEKLQGKWALVAVEREGKKVPEAALKEEKIILTIAGDKLSFSRARKGETKNFDNGSYKIVDARARPKKIDLTGFPKPDEKMLGIYELDGKTLKICVGELKRPTEFASKPGSRTGVLVLRKQ
jgi:uncharacterized protein (TIGR03067 family)